MKKWKLETRNIDTLSEHPSNPRQMTKKQENDLKRSIKKFGLIDKPIITHEGMIIGGHQRLRVLRDLKINEVDCWVCEDGNFTPFDIDELCIRLNKNTGDWNWDKLANEWNQQQLIDWGFNEEELMGLITDVIENDSEEDGETLEPGKDEDAITKLGDVYELNGHRLVCGDSTLPEYVDKCLNGNEPILMVTDPPYGVEYDPSWRDEAGKVVRAKGKVQNDDKVNWALAWHLFPGSVVYVWCASWYLPEVAKSLDDAEYERKSLIIWAKQHFALSRGDYHWQHEPCWYAIKKGHAHNWQGSRKESTLWEISNLNCFGKSKDEDECTAHSTQKPLECMARPIRNNTAPGEGVYDPFLGSGTTLIASEQLGRTCYGIELSPAYCDIIVNRWVNFMVKNKKEFTIKRNGESIKV